MWLVQTEIALMYDREISVANLSEIDCKIDLETEKKERAHSRFDKSKEA